MKHRDTFTGIADPTRRQILVLLLDQGPMVAGDIAARFEGAARPGISRHLRILRECDLVAVEQEGRARRYELNPKPLNDLRDGWLAGFATMYQDSLVALRERVEGG